MWAAYGGPHPLIPPPGAKGGEGGRRTTTLDRETIEAVAIW